MYGIVHPAEQWESGRPMRVSPVYERERALGAVFFETAGLGAAVLVRVATSALLERYAGRLMERPAEWESRWWSPIINAEHLAMRDALRRWSTCPRSPSWTSPAPARWTRCRRLAVAQMDVAVGRVVYTSLLDERGGFRADLTVMRLGADRFRVVTGGATGMADAKWIADHLAADGSAQLADLTSAWTTIGLWGPRARDVLAAVTDDDVSHAGVPVRDLPGGRGRRHRGARVADLLRRRARLGTARADRAGRPAVGRRCGRRASRTAWCRPASACTARPGGWRRDTAPSAPS